MTEAEEVPRSTRLRRTVAEAERRLYDTLLSTLPRRPHFHLLLAVDDSVGAVERARLTLASIAGQIEPHWTVHLVARYSDGDFDGLAARLRDGETTVSALRHRLPHWLDEPDTLWNRLLAISEDLGGRVASLHRRDNLALAGLADGADLIMPVSPGDELGCDALAELALAAGADRDATFFYSDEERLNVESGRIEPFLKPQYSPDLLCGTNYIGRLWCARGGLLAGCGITLGDWLRRGDYDAVLRLSEAAGAIRHVPRVLCRRSEEPVDAPRAEERALSRMLDRRGIDAEIVPGFAPGFYRLKRRIPGRPRVSAIVPTRGSRGLVRTCIESLRRVNGNAEIEIVAVDDIPATDTDLKGWLRDRVDRVVSAAPPFNWSRYNNTGALAATGEYLLFLNDDIEAVETGWLDAMLEEAQRPEVGAVGARLLYPDGTIQHGGMFLAGPAHARHAFRRLGRDAPGYFGLARTTRDVSAVTGACLLTRRNVFDALGGFDDRHAIVNNDLDFCLKVRERGLLCVYTPHAVLIHHEAASRTGLADMYDHAAFDSRWRGVFARGDPYHHPGLCRRTDSVAIDPEPVQAVCTGYPLYDRDTIRKILVVKLDHPGDTMIAMPAVRRLRLYFPGAEIQILSAPWSKPLWAEFAEIDAVIELEFFPVDPALPHLRHSPEELGRLETILTAHRFDLAIDLRPYPETRPLLRRAGARFTAGFDYQSQFPWLDIALDWSGDRPGIGRQTYLGETLTGLIDAIAAAGEQDLQLTSARAQGAAASSVVCVYPAADTGIERWPVSYFAALIDRLIAEDGAEVVVVASERDQEATNAVLAAIGHNAKVSSRIGDLSASDLVTFLKGCALFVGGNSGAKHIAASLGVPTVGIHAGTVDIREWGPKGPLAVGVWRRVACAPCYLTRAEECRHGLACLTELRPHEVYPLCKRLLGAGRARESAADE